MSLFRWHSRQIRYVIFSKSWIESSVLLCWHLNPSCISKKCRLGIFHVVLKEESWLTSRKSRWGQKLWLFIDITSSLRLDNLHLYLLPFPLNTIYVHSWNACLRLSIGLVRNMYMRHYWTMACSMTTHGYMTRFIMKSISSAALILFNKFILMFLIRCVMEF